MWIYKNLEKSIQPQKLKKEQTNPKRRVGRRNHKTKPNLNELENKGAIEDKKTF